MSEIRVELPNGSVILFPEGTPPEVMTDVARRATESLPQQTGAEAMQARGMRSDPAAAAEMNAQSEQAIGDAQAEQFVHDNPVLSRAAKFNQGLPFVGEYVDEAQGAILGPEARDNTRHAIAAMDRARPVEGAVWQTAGGVAGGVAAAPLVAPAVTAAAPASLGGQVVAGASGMAGAGALEGAVSGYGRGEGDGRAAEAGSGALVGGATGMVLGAAAPLAAAGIRNLVSYIKGTDTAEIASTLGISSPAAQAVKVALSSEDGAAAAARLQRAGPNAMLVEGGPSLQAMGDAVANSGGEATRIMREAVDDRVQQGAADVAGAIDTAIPAAAARQKTALGGLYDQAYATPIDYSSDAGRAVESYMTRVPQGVRARARSMIEMDTTIPDQVKQQALVSIMPDGSIKEGTLPSVLEVDWVTRALNDVAKAGDGKGALGGNTNEGRIYGNLAKNLRDATKDAVPAYGTALDAASTEIGIKNATEFGAAILRPSTSWRDVATEMQGMPAVEQEAVRGAVRDALDDTLANVRRTMGRPGTDVGEAVKAVRDLSSRASQQKLEAVLGKQAAADLASQLDEAATAFEIGAALHQNSKTAVRQAVQGSVEGSTAPGAVGKLMAGEPVQATKRLTQILTGRTPEAQEAAKAGIYAEIAKALTQTRGPEAERALMGITQAMQGQALTDEQAQRIAKNVTAALLIGGYSASDAMH